MVKHLFISSLVVFSYVPQEGGNIVDSARRHGGTATVVIGIESPVGTVDRLARESALVVRGTVQSVATGLPPNKRLVVTEFEIAPSRFYKGALTPSKRPGEVARLVVQRPGGTCTFEGLHLRTVVDEFPESESLSVGDEVILFLAPLETEPGKLRIAGGAFGAFRIMRGDVVALTKAAAVRRGDQPKRIEVFERELAPLLRR